MAKLTQKQHNQLAALHTALARGVAYIDKPRTAVCIKAGPATTTLHMTRPLDGAVFYEVEKAIGSDLCLIRAALESLDQFIREYSA
jgi:hypothetical protein